VATKLGIFRVKFGVMGTDPIGLPVLFLPLGPGFYLGFLWGVPQGNGAQKGGSQKGVCRVPIYKRFPSKGENLVSTTTGVPQRILIWGEYRSPKGRRANI